MLQSFKRLRHESHHRRCFSKETFFTVTKKKLKTTIPYQPFYARHITCKFIPKAFNIAYMCLNHSKSKTENTLCYYQYSNKYRLNLLVSKFGCPNKYEVSDNRMFSSNNI